MTRHITRTALAAALLCAADCAANPVLPDFHADPEILFSEQTGKYYIYSTTDGFEHWGGWYFSVFSSDNLKDWKDEGVVLDVRGDQVPWADGNAWAPCIIERREHDGYRYYLYFSANNRETRRKMIGVAVSDSPTGPFTEIGHPIVEKSPSGRGQQIDVDVFMDPESGKYFLYWGNGYMAGAELSDDMLSIRESTVRTLTPKGGTLEDWAYREGTYVIYRNGTYYFMWSVDDTGSPNYHVAYGTAASPLGDITVSSDPVILSQRPKKAIYGTAHNSVLRLPGRDRWIIVYHRINAGHLDDGPGYHRQVCIDRMGFRRDGSIKKVRPTR